MDKSCVTEHTLYQCTLCELPEGVRLFRVPIVMDGSGDSRRLPHEIAWEDISVGDLLIAVSIQVAAVHSLIDILQVWHVLRRESDGFVIRMNNFVGMAGDGEYVYDRIAGLVGLPPFTRDNS